MAGAKVIDCEAHARHAQQLHIAGGELRITHHSAFGDLEQQGG